MNNGNVKTLTGILCTFDTLTKYRINDHIGLHPAIFFEAFGIDEASGKRDVEMKLLIGRSAEDIQVIRHFHKEMHTLYIPNPTVENDLPQ